MYTVFLLLTAAATYVQWRILCRHNLSFATIRNYLLLYVTLAGLAVYTHYTAVLLHGIQVIFWIWLLWRKELFRLLLGLAVAGILLAIPLLPFTWSRLFSGAEANYYYISPLIMLQDVVRTFSLGVTVDFAQPLIQLLVLGASALFLLGSYAARTWLHRVFLLVYLFAVVFGLMAGSLIKPMYQGARHIMVGSPAFLLLAAWGVVWLATKATTARRRLSKIVWSGLNVLTLAMIIGGPATSLYNLYFTDRYAKNDFRELIHYVEEHAGSNDVIVYNNAILLPLHAHYQKRPDVLAAASPIYPYSAELSGAQLESLAERHERIWFVTDPPADNRDRDGIVREWLESRLHKIDERNFLGHSKEVKVIAYATSPQLVETLPTDSQLTSERWAGFPTLSGFRLAVNQPAALPTWWLDLFWQGDLEPAPASYLRFSLQAEDGREWLAHEQALTGINSIQWPDEGYIRQSYNIPLPKALPPGSYTLLLQPLVTDSGSPAGEARALTEVILDSSSSWPVPPLVTSSLSSIYFSNGLVLQALDLPDTEVRPGHGFPFTVYWRAENQLVSSDQLQYRLEIIGPDDGILRQYSGTPGANWLTAWPANAAIQENIGLYFPPEVEPGDYRLRWWLLDGNEELLGRPSWRPWSSKSNFFGEIKVVPWPLVTTLPEVTNVVQADYGTAIQLYGFDLDRPDNRKLYLTLYWQAKAIPENNFFTFIHVVSSDTGEIVSQRGFVPVDGLRPTRGWRVNEVLADSYVLSLPGTLVPGKYQLIVGLFKPESGERPSVFYAGALQKDNQLVLTTLSLP
jgi:hypothetical protein